MAHLRILLGGDWLPSSLLWLSHGFHQENGNTSSGWWFGCHQFYFPIPFGFIIIPIDGLIFFRGVAQPPTRIDRLVARIFQLGFWLWIPEKSWRNIECSWASIDVTNNIVVLPFYPRIPLEMLRKSMEVGVIYMYIYIYWHRKRIQ